MSEPLEDIAVGLDAVFRFLLRFFVANQPVRSARQSFPASLP